MGRSIALVVGAVTRTLTLDSQSNNGTAVFTEKAGPLIGRLRLVSRISPNGNGSALRSSLKLEKAVVSDCSGTNCGTLPTVQYKQVWSHDISVVTASTEAERQSLYDLTKALIATADVEAMVVDGASLDV